MNKFSISKRMKGLKPFTLNFGLQHSVAHDPLRLILTLFGAVIIFAYSYISLLHLETEKLMKYKNYLQVLPYLDVCDSVVVSSVLHSSVEEIAHNPSLEDFNLKELEDQSLAEYPVIDVVFPSSSGDEGGNDDDDILDILKSEEVSVNTNEDFFSPSQLDECLAIEVEKSFIYELINFLSLTEIIAFFLIVISLLYGAYRLLSIIVYTFIKRWFFSIYNNVISTKTTLARVSPFIGFTFTEADYAVIKAALAKKALALALFTLECNVIGLLFFTLFFDYVLLLIYYEVVIKYKL